MSNRQVPKFKKKRPRKWERSSFSSNCIWDLSILGSSMIGLEISGVLPKYQKRFHSCNKNSGMAVTTVGRSGAATCSRSQHAAWGWPWPGRAAWVWPKKTTFPLDLCRCWVEVSWGFHIGQLCWAPKARDPTNGRAPQYLLTGRVNIFFEHRAVTFNQHVGNYFIEISRS